MSQTKFDYKFIKASGNKLGTILFVHGYAVDYSYFVADKELAKNYDYYALNLPAHGNIKANFTKKDMKEKLNFDYIANHVCEFVKEKNLNDFILIGHSMGGGIVSLVSNLIPDKIRKLILVSPMNFAAIYKGPTALKLCVADMKKKIKVCKYLYKDVSLHSGSKEWMAMNEFQVNNTKNNLKEMKYLLHKVMSSLSTLLKVNKAQKNISVPTLLCLGKYDGVIPYKQTKKRLTKNIKDLKLVTFENSGHLCFEEETDKFIKEVNSFIQA